MSRWRLAVAGTVVLFIAAAAAVVVSGAGWLAISAANARGPRVAGGAG